MMETILVIAVAFSAGYATRAWVSYRRRRLAEQISVYFYEPSPAPSQERVGRAWWESLWGRLALLREHAPASIGFRRGARQGGRAIDEFG
jgi:hypothetical protein